MFKLQDDLNRSSTNVIGNLSRPRSQNAGAVSLSGGYLSQQHSDIGTLDGIRSGRTSPGLVRVQSLGSKAGQSFAAAVDPSLAINRTPESLVIGRSSSPCLPAVGNRVFDVESKKVSNGFSGLPTQGTDYVDVAAALAGLNLSNKIGGAENEPYNTSSFPGLICNEFSKNTGILKDDISAMASNEQISLQKCLSSSNLSKNAAPVRKSSFVGPSSRYQPDSLNANFTESNLNTYLLNHGVPSMLNNHLDSGIL